MLTLGNTDLFIGLVAGTIFAGAMLASPIFRQLALAAAASGLVFLYIERGIRGVLAIAAALQFDLFAYPYFAYGFGAAAFIALASASFRRRRSLTSDSRAR